MDALILAAGFGSRLSVPLNKKPKSLLQLNHKTILYYLIKRIQETKIKKIFIVVGYKKKLIKSYLKKVFQNKIKIYYISNDQYKNKGNIYSIHLARKKISNDLLMFNADIVLPKNILLKLVNNPNKNIFLVNLSKYKNEDDILFEYNNKKIVKKVYIKERVYKKKLVPSAGVLKISKKGVSKFFSIIKKKNFKINKYYENAYRELIKEMKFKIYVSKKRIIEVDTKKDYIKLKRKVQFDKSYL